MYIFVCPVLDTTLESNILPVMCYSRASFVKCLTPLWNLQCFHLLFIAVPKLLRVLLLEGDAS